MTFSLFRYWLTSAFFLIFGGCTQEGEESLLPNLFERIEGANRFSLKFSGKVSANTQSQKYQGALHIADGNRVRFTLQSDEKYDFVMVSDGARLLAVERYAGKRERIIVDSKPPDNLGNWCKKLYYGSLFLFVKEPLRTLVYGIKGDTESKSEKSPARQDFSRDSHKLWKSIPSTKEKGTGLIRFEIDIPGKGGAPFYTSRKWVDPQTGLCIKSLVSQFGMTWEEEYSDIRIDDSISEEFFTLPERRSK